MGGAQEGGVCAEARWVWEGRPGRERWDHLNERQVWEKSCLPLLRQHGNWDPRLLWVAKQLQKGLSLDVRSQNPPLLVWRGEGSCLDVPPRAGCIPQPDTASWFSKPRQYLIRAADPG